MTRHQGRPRTRDQVQPGTSHAPSPQHQAPSTNLLQRLDALARQQKRYWFAETKRGIKIARHSLAKTGDRVATRTAKTWSHYHRKVSRIAGLWMPKLMRPLKIVAERSRNAVALVRNLSRKAGLRAWALRRPFKPGK